MRAIPQVLLLFVHITLIGLGFSPLVCSRRCYSHADLQCNASTVAYVFNRDGTLQQLQLALSQASSMFTSSPLQTATKKPGPVHNDMDVGGGPVQRALYADYVPGSSAIPVLRKPLASREMETQQEGDRDSVHELSERTSLQLCCDAWAQQCVGYKASLSFAYCYDPKTYTFQLSNGASGSETLESTYTDRHNGSFQDLALDFDYFASEPAVSKQSITDESILATTIKHRGKETVTLTWADIPSESRNNTSMVHHFVAIGTTNDGRQQSSKKVIWKKMMFLVVGWATLASTTFRGGTARTGDDDGQRTEDGNDYVKSPAPTTTSQFSTKANILSSKLRSIIGDLSNKGRQKFRVWCRRHPRCRFQERGLQSGVWNSATNFPEMWSRDSSHHRVCMHHTNPTRLKILQLLYLTDCPICEELLPHQMFFEEVLPLGLEIEELGRPLVEVEPEIAEYTIIQGYEGYVKVGSDLEMVAKWAREEKIGPRGVGRGW